MSRSDTQTHGHDLGEALLRQFEISWSLTEYHLNGLETEECLWRPSTRGMHVHLQDGRWKTDWPDHESYELGPPSIAWLSWHITFWWSMVIDHSFGSAKLAREDVSWPGTAEAVRSRIVDLQAEWRRRIWGMSDDELRSRERTRWPFQNQPFVDVVGWLNIELAKNASEIGYVRFLYAVRT